MQKKGIWSKRKVMRAGPQKVPTERLQRVCIPLGGPDGWTLLVLPFEHMKKEDWK
jgi:hypothetical protein